MVSISRRLSKCRIPDFRDPQGGEGVIFFFFDPDHDSSAARIGHGKNVFCQDPMFGPGRLKVDEILLANVTGQQSPEVLARRILEAFGKGLIKLSRCRFPLDFSHGTVHEATFDRCSECHPSAEAPGC